MTAVELVPLTDAELEELCAESEARTPKVKRERCAEALVTLAQRKYTFATTRAGEALAIPREGPRVARPLRGTGGLRSSLAAAYHAQPPNVVPSSRDVTDAIAVLEGKALAEPAIDLPLRVARTERGIVLDLARRDGKRVHIHPGRWEIVEWDASPTVFAQTALTSAMPLPERGGSLDELRSLLNVTDDSWPLVVGWLVAAMMPGWPHPVAFPAGEQGTGKTSCARMLVQLVDPSASPVRKAPRDEDDWVVAASGSWVVALDNLSSISTWFSDAICRAVTGEGLVKRRLYSDSDLSVLTIQRAIILTSIDAGALRGDLADRLLTIDLEPIPATCRRTDAELSATFEKLRPRILGALLDLVAEVLEALPGIELDEAPRMADFARVLAAIDQCRGLHALELYGEQARELVSKVVESDLVAPFVLGLMRSRDTWEGSATELHQILTPAPRPPTGWPATAHTLTGRLRRIAPALRESGVDFSTKRVRGSRRVVLTRVEPADRPPAALAEEPF